MSHTLERAEPITFTSPLIFEYAKKELQQRKTGLFTLRGAELWEHPITAYFDEALALAEDQVKHKVILARISCWTRRTPPNTAFTSNSTREWHHDFEGEILVTDTQGPEFISGHTEEFPGFAEHYARDDNMRLALNYCSDQQLLDAGFTIEQMMPHSALLTKHETFHRTAVNGLAEPVTRNLVSAVFLPR